MSDTARFQPLRHLAVPVRTIVLCYLVTLLASCAAATPAPEPAPEPAANYPGSLHWSRGAVEHRAIFEQTFRLAAERLEALSEGRQPGTWGISSDADETLIDNSQFQKEISSRGEAFSIESWYEWVGRREATALPGAVDFTRRVKEMGGVVAIVTNRDSVNCGATADNLRQLDITFDVVLCQAGTGQKEPRWDALRDGTASQWPGAQMNGGGELPPVDLLMWLGDNIGDFPDLDQTTRDREDPLSEFGDRFFAFPNPMYGSWMANPKE